MAQRSAAEKDSTPRWRQVLALGQSYPQLNSSNNFLNLQDNLADTENKLAFARQYYNDAVATLNRLISTIPWMFVAPTGRGVRARVLPDSALTRRSYTGRVRIVFAGTPEPALPSLRRLIESPRHDVIAVLTRPDAAAGRRGKPVAVAGGPAGARARHPGAATAAAQRRRIRRRADRTGAGVLCGGRLRGATAPNGCWPCPQHGWVNLHFSLLPAWRGAAPVQAAIAAGDAVTGATTFRIEPSLDSGPVYGVVTETIRPTDTAGDLLERLSVSGAALLETTLDGIADGSLTPVPQPADGVTVAPKVTVEEARVRWDLPAHVVERRIRAVTPNPGAWTMIGDLRVKLGPVDSRPPMRRTALPPGANSGRPRRRAGRHRFAAGAARPHSAAGQEADERRRLGARCPARRRSARAQ